MSAPASSAWTRALAEYARSTAHERISTTTQRVREARLHRMASDLGGDPWAVTRQQLATWLDDLPGSPATVKEYRGAARAFYRWAVIAGQLEHDPTPAPAPRSRYTLAQQWTDALELFATAQRAARHEPATVALRVKHVERFAREVERMSWQVSREHLLGWLESVGVGDSTRRVMRTSLRAFYRWAHSTGRIADDPSAEPSARAQQLDVPEQWREPLRAYRSYLRSTGHPETTVRTRGDQIRRFARDHASLDPFDVTLDDLIEWMAGKRWSVEYRRGNRGTLQSFYRWAEDTGRTDENPAQRMPVVKAAPPCPRPALESEYAAALLRADNREALALRLAAELGMRRGEVAAVHRRDLIDDTGGWSLRVHGKGRKVRMLPLPDDMARALRIRPDGYLFPGQDHGHLSARWLGKLISQLLPAGVTMHALRHRFATLAYNVDRDVFTVQQLLGHASPATTQRYVQVNDDSKRRLMQAVASPHRAPALV
jgi:integrase